YVSDSDSDYDESSSPEVILRQVTLALINKHTPKPNFKTSFRLWRVLKACLRSLRILSRDKKVLGRLITDRALLTLAHLGGFSHAPVPKEDTNGDADPYNDIIQAISESKLGRADEDDHGGEEVEGSGAVSSDVNDPVLYALRLMFLLTALRPELRAQLKQEGGVPLLTTELEKSLSVQWKEEFEVVLDPTAPLISLEDSQQDQEGDASLYRHLAAVLRHCLMVSCEEEETADEHAVNMLSALPLSCLDVLVSVSKPHRETFFKNYVMLVICDFFNTMMFHMQGEKVKERLTPVLNLLTKCSRAHRDTRHYLRQQILPPLRDLKHCAADLLFVLCKENGNHGCNKFIKSDSKDICDVTEDKTLKCITVSTEIFSTTVLNIGHNQKYFSSSKTAH
uniref:Synembryn n=1 Tax=Cyprinus carpio TaxID=7962 RepID=A0A8C1IFD4_CYPCA